MTEDGFCLLDWRVLPHSNKLATPKEEITLNPKSMDVLVFLAERQGEVVSKEEILDKVWSDTFVGDGVLWRSISEIRQTFNDEASDPRVISTIAKRGYRLEVPVRPLEETREEPRNRGRRWAMIAAGMGFVGLCLGLGWLLISASFSSEDVSGGHASPLTVLVAQFENFTGEATLEGTLDFALEQYLLNSGLVRVASPERIQATLELMRLAPDSRVDEKLARRITLRDEGIDVVLSGRLDKIGEEYLLNFRLVDPRSDQVLAVSTREVPQQDQLLDEMGELATWVLRELEDARQESHREIPSAQQLQKVTTDSLEALRLYSKAVRSLRMEEPYEEIETLARQAVQEDPAFAAAQLLLAWIHRYQGQDREAQLAMDRAMQLRENASLAERAFIQGSYHHWRDEFAEAETYYEMTLDLQPEHPWALVKLFNIGWAPKPSADLINSLVRRAESLPNSLQVQGATASLLIHPLGQLEKALPLMKRARQLIAENPDLIAGRLRGAWALSTGIWEKWLDGDVGEAAIEAERVNQFLTEMKGKGFELRRDAAFLAYQYLALGKFAAARDLFEEYDTRALLLPAVVALLDRDSKILERGFKGAHYRRRATVPLIALDLDPSLVSELEGDPGPRRRPGSRELVLGKLELERNQIQEGITLLQQGLDLLPDSATFYLLDFFLGSLTLSRAREQMGQLEQAAAVLEEASSYKKETYPESSLFWIIAQGRLARLYREMGRLEKARDIEAELKVLLEYADPDFVSRVNSTPWLKMLNPAELTLSTNTY